MNKIEEPEEEQELEGAGKEKEEGLEGQSEDSETLDFLQVKQKRYEVELDSAPVKRSSSLGKILMAIIIVLLVIAVLAVLAFMFL